MLSCLGFTCWLMTPSAAAYGKDIIKYLSLTVYLCFFLIIIRVRFVYSDICSLYTDIFKTFSLFGGVLSNHDNGKRTMRFHLNLSHSPKKSLSVKIYRSNWHRIWDHNDTCHMDCHMNFFLLTNYRVKVPKCFWRDLQFGQTKRWLNGCRQDDWNPGDIVKKAKIY